MKQIVLTKARVAVVDDEDFSRLSITKWFAVDCAGSFYARTHIGGGKQEYMHRIVMNAPRGMQVDHVNHDTLDNRKENLRLCTQSQNNANMRKPSGKWSSRYKGVTWHSKRRKWCAHGRVNGRYTHLGLFVTEEDAARAYDANARKQYGDFALVNFQ